MVATAYLPPASQITQFQKPSYVVKVGKESLNTTLFMEKFLSKGFCQNLKNAHFKSKDTTNIIQLDHLTVSVQELDLLREEQDIPSVKEKEELMFDSSPRQNQINASITFYTIQLKLFIQYQVEEVL